MLADRTAISIANSETGQRLPHGGVPARSPRATPTATTSPPDLHQAITELPDGAVLPAEEEPHHNLLPRGGYLLPFRLVIQVGCATQPTKETTVSVQVTAIMLGVQDLNRSKQFYGEGLGCMIDQDHPTFVSFNLGDGSSSLALYQWDAAAQDAGVSPEGSGFRGVSFHFIVASREAVDEVMGKAVGAGGSVVKEAAAASWGGYFGYFGDPDGYLWKVAAGA
jgi:catechol 2,3-dioxygenase-like lactoylglutathione lyase family enzyme